MADGIYSMWLDTDDIAQTAKTGTVYFHVYVRTEARLLPRPISICEIDREGGKLRLVYRVTGKNTGTEEFSRTAGRRYDLR